MKKSNKSTSFNWFEEINKITSTYPFEDYLPSLKVYEVPFRWLYQSETFK